MTQLMQLDLLSLQGESQGTTAEIKWIPIELLQPHPDNPRLIYREDIIDTIAQSITESGFNPCYALLVRPMGTEYQIVSGHTRLKSAQKAGCKKLPCWVKDIDDEAAFMELVLANNQGELSPLEYGMHVLKYVELSEGGRGKKGGLSEYARVVGKSESALRYSKEAAVVFENLAHVCEVSQILDKSRHLAAIHKAPEQYWQQLTELLIEKEWSVKDTEAIVSNIREINIPDRYHHWLNPEKAIKETIAESLKGETARTPRDLKNWIAAADECLELLPDSRKVTLVRNDKETIEYWNLQKTFLSRLPDLCAGAKKPSAQRIKDLAQSLLSEVKGLDDRHASWLASKASEEERKKRDEEERLKQLQMQSAYSPKGFNADIEDFLKDCTPETYNSIITDVPYCVSNGGFTLRSGKESVVDKNFEDSITPDRYVPQFFEILKPGGTFLTTCTHHILPELINVAIESGFEFRQQLIWFRPGSPPLLSADRFQPDYENILVFVKPGPHYFGYNDIKLDDDKQRGAVIQMPQCSGQERQYNHDTQKPEALYEILIKAYCPKDGTVLDPFGGSGTTPAVCKRLQRICHWVEKSPEFFAVASDRIEATPFHWEV